MINSIKNFDLRKWQENALEIWLKKMNGVVSVVTGGGKTFFAILCIIEFFKKYPDGRILVIVPTIALQSQWRIELIKTLKIEESKISCFPNKKSITNKINIIIINTARKIFKPPFEKKDLFLIVDECHRSGSQKNSQALNFKTVAELGLSATPQRENDSGFEDFIRPKLGPIIYNYSYKEAFKNNVISNFDMFHIKTSLTYKEKQDYSALSKRIAIELGKKVHSKDKLDMLLIKRARISKDSVNRIPVAIRIIKNEKNKKIIVFTESISHANIICQKLNREGYNASAYHTGISKNIRNFNLSEFYDGSCKILVTCTALDEGLNVPDIEVAVIVSQTMSLRQRIQRIGRAVRKGKDKAKIYTIYITDDEKNTLIEEFTNLHDISNFKWLKTGV
tara:strand:- start:39 stop:1214 length:1176 start_codon:yes stop_codon:yes gene_type:complete